MATRRARSSTIVHLRRLLALLLGLTLVATACGGGGSSDDGGGGDQQAEEGEPRRGGRMVIAVEAEVDGFDGTQNRWPVSGHVYANAVYDPLAMFNADNEVVPYLAESIEPNEDHTVWTITLRDGIEFHNGDPLNADAVMRNLEAHRASALTGPAIAEIETIGKVDDLTLQVHLRAPRVIFPTVLTAQVGYVMAPAMLDDPEGSRNPIGTGPFVFRDWEPGSRLRLERNESYWRADEGLPYLDELEIRPIQEPQSRTDALLSGDVDLIHTSAGESIRQLREAGDQIRRHEVDEGAAEENMLLVNTAAEPFDNVHARRAISLAIDREQYSQVVDQGVSPPANSPFSGQDEFPEPDGGYQHFDPDEARAQLEAYLEDTGEDALSFEMMHLNTTIGQRIGQLLQGMWGDVGIEVSLRAVESSQQIQDAILGDFQVSTWRQHGAPEPDQEYVWWNIDNANEIGTPSINFGRYRNEDLQAILDGARGVPDADRRAEMYGDVVQIFAEDVPFVYLTRGLWAFGYGHDVGGVTTPLPLPGGEPSGNPFPGLVRAAALYVDEG